MPWPPRACSLGEGSNFFVGRKGGGKMLDFVAFVGVYTCTPWSKYMAQSPKGRLI